MVEVPRLNRAAFDVCNFFESLGKLQRLRAFQAESVWSMFGMLTKAYWILCKPALKRVREEREDSPLYEDFERLYRLVADIDRKRGIAKSPLRRSDGIRRILISLEILGVVGP
jgi:hypothetical protein